MRWSTPRSMRASRCSTPPTSMATARARSSWGVRWVRGLLAECQVQGLAFMPFFPLASGLLTGKYRKGQPVPQGTRLSDSPRGKELLTGQNLDIIEALHAFASSRGHTLLELAISWLL